MSGFFTEFWATMLKNPLPEEFFSAPIGRPVALGAIPKNRGRPTQTYEEKAKSAKISEVNKIMEASGSTAATIQAASRLSSEDGFTNAASILKQMAKDPEPTAEKLKKAQANADKTPVEVDVEYALFHLLLSNQTKAQYNLNKKANDKHNAKIWPNYHKLLNLKKQLLSFGGMEFAEDGSWATADMQTCLNQQMSRLVTGKLKAQIRAIKRKEPNIKFVLDFKVGADGSSRHSEYQTRDACDQGSMFNSNMVLCQIRAEHDGKSNIVWFNNMCNSPFACIPLRFAHEKETSKNSKREGQRLKAQMENLRPYLISGLGNTEIEFRGCRSLIDGHTRCLV